MQQAQKNAGTKILIADKLHPKIVSQLSRLGNVSTQPKLNGGALTEQLKVHNPEFLVVRSTKVQKEHLNANPNLSVVIRAGAGTNTIDILEASNVGIFVCNCPGKNAIAVAELAMGHLINLDRRIADNVATLRKGEWAKKTYAKGRGLSGRSLAIIGCAGQIGKNVAKRALAFGMVVRGYDPFLTPAMAKALGVVYCETPEAACRNADAVTVHVPYLKATHHLLNEKVMSQLKDGAYVINTSRGGVVDEKALIKLIDTKSLRAGLDVYEVEPKSSDNVFKDEKIFKNGSIYGTHHIGASTDQATEAVGLEVIRIIETFKNTGHIENCVNLQRFPESKFALSVRHNDVVGVLAFILEVLRAENTNVQEMENVVFNGRKTACAKLQLDSRPSNDAIMKIQQNPNIIALNLTSKL